MGVGRSVLHFGWRSFGLLWFIALGLFFTRDVPTVWASDVVDAGYRDFSYGTACSPTPSGEKPESKLWFNDGVWWGSLCNGSDNKHHIYRLNLATQDWVDTGTILDDRPTSKADVLWDGQKLYVASALFANSGAPASSSSQWGRLYRYSYNASNQSYNLDSGFPVTITRGKSETIAFDKDSTGKLWVTYTESKKVMVNHSLTSDSDWGVPYVLPVSGASGLSDDDISSLISFSGRIGVMWSNQQTRIMYFAAHADNDANDQNWQVTNAYNPGGAGADDHINLKSLQGDDAGRVFAVAKTSFDTANMPQINLLVCDADPCVSAGNWQAYEIYRGQDGDTRPILLIDPGQRKLHVFTSLTGSGGEVHYKVSDMDNIQFPVGKGQVFIKNSDDNQVNDSSSTKQNVSSATGIVVIASSELTHYYYHNYMTLGSGASPSISGFTPASGAVGTEVTLTGSNFSGAFAVSFNGTAAAFIEDSATQIRATVPAGASTGPLRVTTPNGTGVSANNFTVVVPNQAPSVNAGADQAVVLPGTATLDATVTDDGLPNPPGLVTTTWEKVGGPGTVAFTNPAAVDTTASFSAPGVYVLRLTANDNALSASDEITITVINSGAVVSTEVRVVASSDDAEQQTSGSVSLSSSALELVNSSGNQTVGLRFQSLNLPSGAIITNAYVQFYSTKNSSGATSLTLQGQSIDDAPTFTSANNNISSRTKTSAAVNWSPAAWTQNAAGVAQRTPNLATIVQEIVNRPGWVSNNDLVLIITGTGQRVASSYDRNPAQAPLLHVEYATAGPIINGFTPASGEVGTEVTLSGSNFDGATAVTFNGTAATFTLDSATQIRASVPAGATSGPLSVTTPKGTASSAESFTVLPTNQAPNVNVGADQLIALSVGAIVDATVTDDGLPNPPHTLTFAWEKVSGPGMVTFGTPTAEDTTASFSGPGVYVLRLTASDSVLSGVDEVTIIANQAPSVNAGVDQTLTLPGGATLDGTVSDDGLPNPPGLVTTSWSHISGPGTVTFADPAAVDTTASFSAPGDYVLRLTASDNALTTLDDVTVTVEPVPTVQFSSASYTISENGGVATITVGLSAQSNNVVTVDYATGDSTATAGNDYTTASGTITFNPSQTSQSFTVAVAEDTIDEPDETISLTLNNPSNAVPGTPTNATLTIIDNDNAPIAQFSEATYSVNENGATATISVHLSNAAAQVVAVNYTTSDGAATAGSDYTTASGTLIFNPGQTSQSFTVAVAEDALDEPDETINLALNNPVNATLGTLANASLSLIDNDGAPTVRFSAAMYSVNENGTVATITVNLSNAAAQPVTVAYATSDGTATAGSDYTAASGTLTFNPGQTSQSFTIAMAEDALDELDETINLALSNPINAALGTQVNATLTLIDNDGAPTVRFSVATYSVNENGANATISVNLSGAATQAVTVDYATSDGTATAGSDYTAASGTLTFNPGQTSQSFTVAVAEDDLDELDETINLTLSNPTHAALGTLATATLILIDNDGTPTVQFGSATYSVNEDVPSATITVNLSHATTQVVTVGYVTHDGTATAGSDYTAASGTLTFNPGQTSQSFTVAVTEDTLDEPDETINLALSDPTNAALGILANATLTLSDNDGTPAVQFSGVTYTISEDGGVATITLTLSAPSSSVVTVEYVTIDGTATAGVDYTAASGTLTFNPGQVSQSFTVAVAEDALDEPDETIGLALSNAVNGAVGTGANTTLTIIDNDGLPTVQFSAPTYSMDENDSSVTITLTLSAPSAQAVAVDYTIEPTSVNARSSTSSGTLTLIPGETAKAFDIPVLPEDRVGAEDNLRLTLSHPVNAVLTGTPSAVLTIVDTDPASPAAMIYLPVIQR